MSFIKFFRSGAWKVVDTANIFRVYKGGAWKDITFMRVYRTVGGLAGWREVWAPAPPAPPPAPTPPPPAPPAPVILNVTITPPEVSGRLFTPGTVQAPKIGNAVANVSNGTGPYTYVWAPVTWSSSYTPQITASNANATKFTQQIYDAEGYETAIFRCTVQDSLGNIGSATVNAEFYTTETGGLA